MGVMLSTVNPGAAGQQVGRPLPGLSDTVLFHLRERRAGVTDVPAFVLGVDVDNRRLKLLVIFDHNDMQTLDGVPERAGDDQGWEYRPGSDARLIADLRLQVAEAKAEAKGAADRLQAFMDEMSDVVWGASARQDRSLQDQINDTAAAVASLHTAPAKGRVKPG